MGGIQGRPLTPYFCAYLRLGSKVKRPNHGSNVNTLGTCERWKQPCHDILTSALRFLGKPSQLASGQVLFLHATAYAITQ